jgi:hypothetical protein
MLGKKGVQHARQVSTVAQPGQLVGQRLLAAFQAERSHGAHRLRQPNADERHGEGRQT